MIGDILQPTHLLFILVIALLVLGPKRLPEAGRSLGRGLRDFRMAMSGESPEERDEAITPPAATATAPAPAATAPAPAATVPTPAPSPVESSEPPREPVEHAG